MNSLISNSIFGPLFILLIAWLPTAVFLIIRALIQEPLTSELSESRIGRRPYLVYIRFICAFSAFTISLLLFHKWSIDANEMNKAILFFNSLLQGVCSWFFIRWVEAQFANSINFSQMTGLPVLGDFSLISDGQQVDLLRERLLTCLNKDTGKMVIGVCEPMEGCGKSLLAASLAKSFSRTNKKVLLIETDLWSLTPHGYIPHSERNRMPGFCELLQNEVLLDGALYYPPDESFVILPRGQLKDKASKLLSSDQIQSVIENCLLRYDRVIIDCPNYERYKDLNKLIGQDGCLIVSISNQMRNKRIFNLIKGLKKGGMLEKVAFVFTYML